MSMEFTKAAGSLYVMEADGQFRRVLTGISISNGLAWDDQRGLMYYIDTTTRGVDVMDYDVQSGSVGNRRRVFLFPEGAGDPDGMTIDREGMLWVAHWGGGCISRWNPRTGEQLAKVEVPAKNVTSCTFGGDLLDELYITTARDGMSEEELQRWPLTGGLFKFKAGVQGVRANIFNDESL
ncbi:L-arabinolactonase [compost metagenome]